MLKLPMKFYETSDSGGGLRELPLQIRNMK